MAAPVVESTSSNTSTSNSVVVTKPTGVAVGDLLMAGFIYYNTGSGQSPNSISGFTTLQSASGFEGFLLAYKIADSGDVSASNYTFGASAASFMAGWMLRISGHASTSAIAASEKEEPNAGETNTTITETAAIAAVSSESLVLTMFCGSTNSATPATTITYSAFNSTPSLTWTERIDTGPVINGSGDGVSIGVAKAPNTGTSNMTQYGCTTSQTLDREYFAAMVIINAIQNATGTNTLLSVSPSFFSENGVAGTIGTNAILSVSPELFSQSGVGTAPPQWSNPDKPSTSWTNENK